MNHASFVGRLGGSPELKTTKDGVSVTSYALAVDRPHTKDKIDWIPCVSWRQQAEYLCSYAEKGNWIAVDGVLTTRTFEDKNGILRKVFELVTDTVKILSHNQEKKHTTEEEGDGQEGASNDGERSEQDILDELYRPVNENDTGAMNEVDVYSY